MHGEDYQRRRMETTSVLPDEQVTQNVEVKEEIQDDDGDLCRSSTAGANQMVAQGILRTNDLIAEERGVKEEEDEDELPACEYIDVNQFPTQDVSDAACTDPLASDGFTYSGPAHSTQPGELSIFTFRTSPNQKFASYQLPSTSTLEKRMICKTAKTHRSKQNGVSVIYEKDRMQACLKARKHDNFGNKFVDCRPLPRHMILHKSPPRPMYLCDLCGASFKQERELTSHRRVSLDQNCFQCPHCSSTHASPCSVNLHLRSHAESAHLQSEEACSNNLSSKPSEDRVRLPLIWEGEKEMTPQKRKGQLQQKSDEKEKEEVDALEQGSPSRVQIPILPRQEKSKPKKAMPPPTEFPKLLILAKKKQLKSIKVMLKRKPEDEKDRSVTKQLKLDNMKVLNWRWRKEQFFAGVRRSLASCSAPSPTPFSPTNPASSGSGISVLLNSTIVQRQNAGNSREGMKKHQKKSRKMSHLVTLSVHEKISQESDMTTLNEKKKKTPPTAWTPESYFSRPPSSQSSSSQPASNWAPNSQLYGSLAPTNQPMGSASNWLHKSQTTSNQPPSSQPLNRETSSRRPPNSQTSCSQSLNSGPPSTQPPPNQPPNRWLPNSQPTTSWPLNSQILNSRPPSSGPPNSQTPSLPPLSASGMPSRDSMIVQRQNAENSREGMKKQPKKSRKMSHLCTLSVHEKISQESDMSTLNEKKKKKTPPTAWTPESYFSRPPSNQSSSSQPASNWAPNSQLYGSLAPTNQPMGSASNWLHKSQTTSNQPPSSQPLNRETSSSRPPNSQTSCSQSLNSGPPSTQPPPNQPPNRWLPNSQPTTSWPLNSQILNSRPPSSGPPNSQTPSWPPLSASGMPSRDSMIVQRQNAENSREGMKKHPKKSRKMSHLCTLSVHEKISQESDMSTLNEKKKKKTPPTAWTPESYFSRPPSSQSSSSQPASNWAPNSQLYGSLAPTNQPMGSASNWLHKSQTTSNQPPSSQPLNRETSSSRPPNSQTSCSQSLNSGPPSTQPPPNQPPNRWQPNSQPTTSWPLNSQILNSRPPSSGPPNSQTPSWPPLSASGMPSRDSMIVQRQNAENSREGMKKHPKKSRKMSPLCTLSVHEKISQESDMSTLNEKKKKKKTPPTAWTPESYFSRPPSSQSSSSQPASNWAPNSQLYGSLAPTNQPMGSASNWLHKSQTTSNQPPSSQPLNRETSSSRPPNSQTSCSQSLNSGPPSTQPPPNQPPNRWQPNSQPTTSWPLNSQILNSRPPSSGPPNSQTPSWPPLSASGMPSRDSMIVQRQNAENSREGMKKQPKKSRKMSHLVTLSVHEKISQESDMTTLNEKKKKKTPPTAWTPESYFSRPPSSQSSSSQPASNWAPNSQLYGSLAPTNQPMGSASNWLHKSQTTSNQPPSSQPLNRETSSSRPPNSQTSCSQSLNSGPPSTQPPPNQPPNRWLPNSQPTTSWPLNSQILNSRPPSSGPPNSQTPSWPPLSASGMPSRDRGYGGAPESDPRPQGERSPAKPVPEQFPPTDAKRNTSEPNLNCLFSDSDEEFFFH